MGFVGKPSKACEPCRSRRTKCDQQKPRCSQCARKLIPCTYRDPVDLAFRNENETIARKVHSNQLGGRSDDLSGATLIEGSSQPLDLTYLARTLSEPREDVATIFFLSKWSQGMYKDYVPALYLRADCAAVLRSSVEAVGLATLSIIRSEAGLMTAARKSHAIALRQVQQAISSWKTATRTDTLAAIMLLALFAAISSEPNAARIDWTKHMKGALAVLTASHGKEDDDSVTSILSSHVAACVLVDCFQNATEPPKLFKNLTFEPRMLLFLQQKSDEALSSLVNLRHTSVSESTFPTVLKHIDRVIEVLDNHLKTLGDEYPMTVEKQNFGTHELPIHTYPDHDAVNISRIWNLVRMVKLSALELRYQKTLEMQDNEKTTGNDFELNYQQLLIDSSGSAADVILDICASVPACLRSGQAPNQYECMEWSCALLWPLSVTLASPLLPNNLRPFVRRQLQILWGLTRLPIVDYHQHGIEDGMKPHMWTHVFFT